MGDGPVRAVGVAGAVRAVPPGRLERVGEVAVNDGRSMITLDHDWAGKGAMLVKLGASCHLTERRG
jgi:hypothetical protein